MSKQAQNLGGRLPLLNPGDLSGTQSEFYDQIVQKGVPWAEKSGFQSQTEGGKFIGPFNPVLYSPEIGVAFMQLQEIEGKHSTLSQRERQVIILTVGAIWQCDYERYAHAAVARKAGMPEEIIRALASGGLPKGLSEREKLARRYTQQLVAKRQVDATLYREAEEALGEQGLVDLTFLAGIYQLVCGILNGFEIPVPT